MNVERHILRHIRQIRLIAIGSDSLPVGTFSSDVQLLGELFTHCADLRSAIDEHGKFVLVYLS